MNDGVSPVKFVDCVCIFEHNCGMMRKNKETYVRGITSVVGTALVAAIYYLTGFLVYPRASGRHSWAAGHAHGIYLPDEFAYLGGVREAS